MIAGQHDFTIEQGAIFSETITYLDENGDAVNLTSYSARMDIRKSKADTSALISLLSPALDGWISTLTTTPAAGGTGYTPGTITLTLGTGTGGTVSATANSSGVVTAISSTPITRGVGYSVATVATTGGGGTNCTVAIASVDATEGTITLGGVAGTLVLYISAALTRLFTFDRAFYDIELGPSGTDPNTAANTIRLLEGQIILSREATK